MTEFLWLMIPLVATAGFYFGKRRALALAGSEAREPGSSRVELHSLPNHYGQFVLVWASLPPLLLLVLWSVMGPGLVDGWVVAQLEASGLVDSSSSAESVVMELHQGFAPSGDEGAVPNPARDLARDALSRASSILGLALLGCFAGLALAGLLFARSRISLTLRARNHVERALRVGLFSCSVIAVVTTVGIVGSLLFESIRFFELVSAIEFFFSTQWSPQTALRADQVGSSGAFGAIPVFAGTLLITTLAMLIAGPVGLMAAIHLAFYASASARATLKPILEIIAGIPTVVWGSFAALTLGPQVRAAGEALGLTVASESAIAAGLAMGVMIIPFVSSLSDDALNAVPRSLREGSLAMGATESETIRNVMVPAALPGIVGAFLLAVSRAVGETMIVVMAAGLAANLTANPFAAVTTVTVQIVTLLKGDQEFDSAKTLAAFALGLTLFFVTLALNLVALGVVRRFREQYD